MPSLFSLMGSSALVFACRISGAMIVFATQILMARWMGADSLGIYVLAFSWCLLLSTAAGLGFPSASLRFIGENLSTGHPGLAKGYIKYSRKAVLLSSSAVAIIGCGVITLLHERIPANYQQPLFITMACLPVFTLFRLQDKVAHAFSWLALAFAPSMTLRPLLFLLLIGATYFYHLQLSPSLAMGLQFIALGAVTLGQYLLIAPRVRDALGDTTEEYRIRGWTSTAIPLLVSTLFLQYFPELSVTLIGMLLPAADVAVFYSCFRIALFIGFGLSAVNALLAPRISKLHSAGNITELQQHVTQTTRLKFFCGLGLLILLTLFGRNILAWFGAEFVEGYYTLLILAFSQFIIAVTGPVDLLLNLTGHQNRSLKAFSVAVPVSVGLIVTLVPIIGIAGAAVSIVLTAVFWNIWLHSVVVRELQIYPSIFHRHVTKIS